jgi:hypothetical protein
VTDLDDLRVQLERLGRRPVPTPRPEFADELLRRLQSGEADVLPMPTPLHDRDRRRRAPVRIAALGSIAAALLLVIGVLSVLSGGDSKQQVTFDFDPSSTSKSNTVDGVKVNDSGKILQDIDVQDGWVTATCSKGGQFRLANGEVRECKQGDTMQLYVLGKRIFDVQPAAGPAVATVSTEDASVATGDTTSTTVAQAQSVTTPSAPSTNSSSSTTVTSSTTTTGQSTTTVTKPAPSSVPPSESTKLELTVAAERGDKQVTFNWSPYTGPNFGRYVVVRSTGLAAIGFPASGDGTEIWSSTDPATVSYIEAQLPLEVEFARYRLFVVDAAGKVLASSDVVRVELSLGPSTSLPPTPETTITTPTSTTTAPPGTDANG